MAEDNLKDFATNWAIIGLLLFSLISFAVVFMYNNNPIGLNDGTSDILSSTNSSLHSKLYEYEGDSNNLLNITASTNPEVSELGSRDSVASAYGMAGQSKGTWATTKLLISWVFIGEVGKILLSVFGGIIGFFSLYFITKWIRTGT